MTADDIAALFTQGDDFLCARWGRPVAPVVFGLDDASLAIFRDALKAVVAHARHPLADTDPETGANLMIFAMAGWDDLRAVTDLDRLTGIADLPGRLAAQSADRYRLLRFDADGAIRACMTFLRLGGALGQAHPAALAEDAGVNAMLSFARHVTPSPDLARLIRVAYDPALPSCARDPSHALRLAARLAAP